MEVFTTITIDRHTIDFGVATTHEEREAVLAQRFRVYQREGYYRRGIVEDQDEYDQGAVFFAAAMRRSDPAKAAMIGSTRLIRGREDPGFEFPCQKAFRLDLPGVVQDTPAIQRAEVGRLVSEVPNGFSMGRLVTTLGLFQAMTEYDRKATDQAPYRCGVAMIKRRLLRGLQALGLPLREIPSNGLTYPPDGPVAGYFYQHPDPAVPVYWLVAEVAQPIRHVIARYRRATVGSYSAAILRGLQRPSGRARWQRSGESRAGRRRPRTPDQK